MDINIKLSEQSAQDFAELRGFVDDGTITLQDFVTDRLLALVANDCLELANRKAIASVVPVADITSDGSQTILKESIATAMTAKMEREKPEDIKPIKEKI
jgi:hypothetical protein